MSRHVANSVTREQDSVFKDTAVKLNTQQSKQYVLFLMCNTLNCKHKLFSVLCNSRQYNQPYGINKLRIY